MLSKPDIVIATWEHDRDSLLSIRYEVFVEEQKVPVELEQDHHDATATHVLAKMADGRSIGTGRLLTDGRIGRLAVRKEFRGQGVGTAIVKKLVAQATHRNLPHVLLHAQVQSIPFYEKLGFKAQGPEFIEAGILHREMEMGIELYSAN